MAATAMEIGILQNLASVHPVRDIGYLVHAIVHVLADTTGVPQSDAAFTQLAKVKTHSDIAGVDWMALSQSIEEKTKCTSSRFNASLDCVRLLLERAELHVALYVQAKHYDTLTLSTHRYRFPQMHVPWKLQVEVDDFHRVMRYADSSLDAGRAALDHFQREAVVQATSFSSLQVILNRAHEHFVAYQRDVALGNILFELVSMKMTAEKDAASTEMLLVA